MQSINKCIQLNKKARKRKSAENINSVLYTHFVLTNGDGITEIVQEKGQLKALLLNYNKVYPKLRYNTWKEMKIFSYSAVRS